MKTPQTLHEAIQNGITDLTTQLAGTTKPVPRASDIIERHVVDFLRQKFGGLYLYIESGPITTQTVMDRVREVARQIGIERR